MSQSPRPLFGTPPPEQLSELRRRQNLARPGFFEAIAGDAQAFSNRRDERYGPGALRKLGQILRLAWGADEFLSVLLYRVRTALRTKGIPVLPRLLYFANGMLFGVRIGDHAIIAPGLYIPHGQVVVDGLVNIGRRCTLFPWTTIGLTEGSALGPIIGNGVSIGTGARVLGNLAVGDGARVGANAVVLNDVPDGATVVGVPARVVPEPGRSTTAME